MPLDSRMSLACSQMVRMEAAWTDGEGSGGGVSDGGGNRSALSAVPLLARATTSWQQGGQRALADIRDQRRAEGEILGEDFRLDGPPMFALGGV